MVWCSRWEKLLTDSKAKPSFRNIQTKSGNRFPVGLAVVACGAEPNLDLVRNTPLAGPHGSPVTEYLETEEKGIYAIGDLAFILTESWAACGVRLTGKTRGNKVWLQGLV